MNLELTKIVRSRRTVLESIDSSLLQQFTSKVDPVSFSPEIWQGLRHLYIVGSSDFVGLGALDENNTLKPGCYMDETKTWLLLVNAPKQQAQDILSACSSKLERLEVRFTTIKTLQISHLTGLTHLSMSKNKFMLHISGLQHCTALKSLYANKVELGRVFDLNPYDSLQALDIWNCSVAEIQLDHPLPKLKALALCFLPMENVDFVKFMPRLTRVYFIHIRLHLLPECFRDLKKLSGLYLWDLELDDLPDWLPELGLPIHKSANFSGISFDATTVNAIPDMSIFSNSQEFISNWFKSRREGVPLNEVKVVFLGDGEAGKTHTIARLMNDGGTPEGFVDQRTPGVVIKDKTYTIGNRNVKVHFWDFGGQEILHSMHRMFLTSRTLYVVLLNARDDTQDDRARYWLHNIKSFAKDCPVLLVLNKIDQNKQASVNWPELKNLYPPLAKVISLSAMDFTKEEFNSVFTNAMLDTIAQMAVLDEKMFASWQSVKNALQSMPDNYIFGKDYIQLCSNMGVASDGDMCKDLLGLFHNLGVTVCFRQHLELMDYVVLRPNWIINAIYAAIFNKHPENSNGLLSHDNIFDLIQGDSARTNPEEQYVYHELNYVLGVFRQFGLSFPVGDKQEFIPMLCQRDSLEIAEIYAADPDALEFHMTFDYLPSNILHRLMVEMQKDLNLSKVWRTGALFEQAAAQLSAVVKSEGNVLKLYVKGQDPLHHPSTYLCELKEVVDQVVEDMGIAKPVCEIIYKRDGKSQAFKYSRILKMYKNNPEATEYSEEHDDNIPLTDILNQSGFAAAKERKLVKAVLSSCLQLQADRYYWKEENTSLSKEDPRNTYIRNMLRNSKIFASDQSYSGISGAGIQPGELDLDLRCEPEAALSIMEGLNISGASQADKTNWEKHLDKLIHNYNPNGLPFLFLISYVDCSRNSFNRKNGIADRLILHAGSFVPEEYTLESTLPTSPERYGLNGQFIRILRTTYVSEGTRHTVYHIFLQLGT